MQYYCICFSSVLSQSMCYYNNDSYLQVNVFKHIILNLKPLNKWEANGKGMREKVKEFLDDYLGRPSELACVYLLGTWSAVTATLSTTPHPQGVLVRHVLQDAVR